MNTMTGIKCLLNKTFLRYMCVYLSTNAYFLHLFLMKHIDNGRQNLFENILHGTMIRWLEPQRANAFEPYFVWYKVRIHQNEKNLSIVKAGPHLRTRRNSAVRVHYFYTLTLQCFSFFQSNNYKFLLIWGQ